MNDTMDTTEQRVRQALHAVAHTLTEDAFGAVGTPATRTSHRRRRIVLGVGALALIPATFAAAAIVNQGPEYVDTIPPERIVMSGSVDGSRYLLIETDRTGQCDEPVTGVELVEESENLLGSEWNTSGYEYGEHVETHCGGNLVHVNDTARYLEDPALFNSSGTEVGNSFVWVYSVHPDVTAVRITSGSYVEELEVFEVDGAGYVPFEIPEDMTEYTAELLIGDQVVPGSAEERTVPQP